MKDDVELYFENYSRRDFAILILSFDDYNDLWKPCVINLRKFFKLGLKIYVLNNSLTLEGLNVEYLNTGHKDDPWSTSVLNGLGKIKEKWVFTFFDDFIMYDASHMESIIRIMNWVSENDIDYISLSSRYTSKRILSSSWANVGIVREDSRYRNSLVNSLINVKVFEQILAINESAWSFETIGNKRSSSYNFYQWIGERLFYQDHIVRKGQGIGNYEYYQREYALKERKMLKSERIYAIFRKCYFFILRFGRKNSR